jgi:hypothetical protein
MAVGLSALRSGYPLPPGRFLVLISIRGRVDRRAIVRLERLGQLKNSMNPSEIEPATFRLVTWLYIQFGNVWSDDPSIEAKHVSIVVWRSDGKMQFQIYTSRQLLLCHIGRSDMKYVWSDATSCCTWQHVMKYNSFVPGAPTDPWPRSPKSSDVSATAHGRGKLEVCFLYTVPKCVLSEWTSFQNFDHGI